MRKSLLTLLIAAYSLFCNAQKQDVMVVEKSNNTTLRINVDDINNVVFEPNAMVIKKRDNTQVRLNADDVALGWFESTYSNPIGIMAETVDLGLPSGVRWAKWNLGATNASGYGGYYGWGDTTGQNTSTNINEYPSANPPYEISGTQYDIAKSLWGGQWRLPTYDDITELYEQCEFYKSGNDVKVVGPNGNSIILPLAGAREGTEIFDTGNYANFWSGTIQPEDRTCAWLFTLDMVNGQYGIASGSRYYGLSIRPVWGTPQPAATISVTTNTATNVTETTATLNGSVSVSNATKSYTAGFFLSTSTNSPSSSNYTKKVTYSSSNPSGNFSVSASGLSSGTTYYCRAYVLYDGEYYYGTTRSFTTTEESVYCFATTNDATNIEQTSAQLNGYFVVKNAKKQYTIGFVISTNSVPTFSNSSSTYVSFSNANYSSSHYATISQLSSATKYYFRAYVQYDGEYYYGEIKSFTTAGGGYTKCPDSNHPHMIDLGLPSGTKWACCNVGASKPEGYGNYYAWGETQPKSVFSWSNYIHCDGSYSTCHDLGSDIAGTNYDAATANWGSPWCMPTKAQCDELRTKCTSEWKTQNGVNGRKFTGPSGGTIFLPAAGGHGSGGAEAGSDGCYWSSTLTESILFEAWNLKFNSGGVYMYYNNSRFYGRSVRPVRMN